MAEPVSPYYSDTDVAAALREGRHRDLVGGMWEELGQFQLNLLMELGLEAGHTLLDVGCGALRGGRFFVGYLQPGNYYGIDLRQELIDAGYELEVAGAGLAERLPASNLVADGEFNAGVFGRTFDFALAFSVFTHLPLNHVRLCLEKLTPAVNPGGKFVATFFERPISEPSGNPQTHAPAGVTTFAARDPYHYSRTDIEFACEGMPWRVSFLENTNHPRGQKVACFERLDGTAYRPSEIPAEEADGLPAGSGHYRAYVGPPERFDVMSASQFALLFQFGLRDTHSLLDVGCGSLRLGRLAIPFLRPGNYAGIDPNRWLIEDGISFELGQSAVRIKRPQFDYNDRFDCSVFGRKFDFVMAQSIITHTGSAMTNALIASVAQNLNEEGVFLFSYIDPERNPGGLPPTEGWHYPECVHYSRADLANRLSDHGLSSWLLSWHHPGATWMAAARSSKAIPLKVVQSAEAVTNSATSLQG